MLILIFLESQTVVGQQPPRISPIWRCEKCGLICVRWSPNASGRARCTITAVCICRGVLSVGFKADDKIHRNNSLCVVARDCGTERWNGQDPPTRASRRSKEKPTRAAAPWLSQPDFKLALRFRVQLPLSRSPLWISRSWRRIETNDDACQVHYRIERPMKRFHGGLRNRQ